MTPETIKKLDAITKPEDLTWRKESYDAGHPKCLCSACGEPIRDTEDFANMPGYNIGQCQEDNDNFPVRLWSGEGKDMIEAVVHMACFTYLHSKKTLHE